MPELEVGPYSGEEKKGLVCSNFTKRLTYL